MVAPLRSVTLNLWPSTTTKVNRMAERPISHEPSEMESSFIGESSSVFECADQSALWPDATGRIIRRIECLLRWHHRPKRRQAGSPARQLRWCAYVAALQRVDLVPNSR